jgi:TRAP transporter 4TM/12TM fusion protein
VDAQEHGTRIETLKASVDRQALGVITAIIAICMVTYHIVSSYYVFLTPHRQMNLHLILALLLVFLSRMRKEKNLWQFGIMTAFAAIALVTATYVHIRIPWLEIEMGMLDPPWDVVLMGSLLIIVIIEASRRAYGLVMPIIFLIFLAYPFFAYYLPGPLHGSYSSPQAIVSRVTIGSLGIHGIYGTVLDVSVNIIFLFIVFGTLLQTTGASRFFIQCGRFIGGKLAGGPALAAVIISCAVGMITGSPIANVATVGSFTIPMMKRAGYKPYQAGAIEATASTGGQIMPPVMGAAAFIMSAFTGIPYIHICAMAVAPALLYYLSAGLYAQFRAMDLKLQPPPEKVDYREMWLNAPLFFVPLIFLCILLAMSYPLNWTMSFTILLTLVLSQIRKETRRPLMQWINGFTEGAIAAAEVAVICAGIGIMLGSLSMTVLAIKIPALVLTIAGGKLWLGLILTMVATIILGTGLPAGISYILVAITCVPGLIKLGVPMETAHFFAFYYGCIAFITPPVAMASLVAARMAGAPFFRTGYEACKVCAGGLIVPFLCIWCPSLLLIPEGPFLAIAKVACCIVVIVGLQISICRHYLVRVEPLERVFFAVVTLILVIFLAIGNVTLIFSGILIFILATVWQGKRRHRMTPHPQTYTASPSR